MAPSPRGYFGKVPASKDFVFHGLPMRTSCRWADHMAEWFALGSRAHGGDWQKHVLASPVWRFALDREVISAESWIGLMAGSIDGAGRLFPFAAMAAVELDLGQGAALAAMDRALDGLELPLLEFMEHRSAEATAGLVSALDTVAVRASGMRIDAEGEQPASPGIGEVATVTVRQMHAPALSLAASRQRQDSAESAAKTLWWHAGTSEMAEVVCMSSGMPPARHAVALFDGDWQRHGWEPR